MWKNRSQRDLHPKQTLLEIKTEKHYKYSLCLFMVSTGLIIVYKDDSKEHEQRAEELYKESVAKGNTVRYENRKTNKLKTYNIFLGEKEMDLPSVDFECLKKTIAQIQQRGIYNKRNSPYLKKIFFSFIFRLLDEGEFGSLDKNLSGRHFLAFLKEEGFKPGGHSNFFELLTKLKPRSRYPNWELTDMSYKKNIAFKLNDINSFAKDFVNTYQKARKE